MPIDPTIIIVKERKISLIFVIDSIIAYFVLVLKRKSHIMEKSVKELFKYIIIYMLNIKIYD